MKFLRRVEMVMTPSNDGSTFGGLKALYVLGSSEDQRLGSQAVTIEPQLSSDALNALSKAWSEAMAQVQADAGVQAAPQAGAAHAAPHVAGGNSKKKAPAPQVGASQA